MKIGGLLLILAIGHFDWLIVDDWGRSLKTFLQKDIEFLAAVYKRESIN